MATSAGSLASAISAADKKETVLDDHVDVEDHAAFIWLKAHILKGFAGHRSVVGTETLSPAWSAQKKKFLDATVAQSYLHHFAKNHASMLSLQTLAHSLGAPSAPAMTEPEVMAAVAAALVSGRVWLIELPKHDMKSRYVTKTNPAAFAPINPKLGTNVDFTFIAKLEGDQWLRGYVPFKKTGIVAGRSGMTVASGFDLGQWSEDDFTTKMHFPAKLVGKIKIFADPNNFKGLNKVQVAARVAKLGPVPVLDKTEADLCDGVVFQIILSDAKSAFDRGKGKDVVSFTSLPSGWQTVWLSRFYQEGPGPKNSQAILFRSLARAGRWKDAVTALRNYTDYKDRAEQEAKLLEQQMPTDPAVPKPKVPLP